MSNHMVDDLRPRQVGESPTCERTGQDGKQYPARRAPVEPQDTNETYVQETAVGRKLGPPANGPGAAVRCPMIAGGG